MLSLKEHNLPLLPPRDLDPFVESYFDLPIPFLKVFKNKNLWLETNKFVDQLKNQFDQFVVVGIGGSHLGAESFVKALTFPRKVLFLENPDPVGISRRWKAFKDISKTHFIFISRSGCTFETLALANWVISQLKAQNLNLSQHSSVITAQKSSPLYQWAVSESVQCLLMPEELSGRFSTLSPVGVVPLLLALDISQKDFFEAFNEGIVYALNEKERTQQLVSAFHFMMANEEHTMNYWIYSDQMQSFGRWLRQLWSESLGQKNLDLQYSLPSFVLCKGASDQHSYLQHALGRPQGQVNFILTLKEVDQAFAEPSLENNYFQQVNWVYEGRRFLDIFNSESSALLKTFLDLGIPCCHLEMESISIPSLVDYVLLNQLAIASLGTYLNIDPFVQPQVEELKKRLPHRL